MMQILFKLINVEITEEQYKEIEKWASVFYSVEDVALIMQFDKKEFINEYNDKNSEVYKTFKRSRLKQKGELILSVFNQAKAGSGPAQTLALKLIKNFELDEIK